MKKLGWYVVSAMVGALILFGGFLLAANLYVQSRSVQQRIRQALSASLRMPVLLKKTTFTPWDGLRIDGISARPVREPSDAASGDKVATYLLARSFRVQFAFGPLLRRRYMVEDVLLDYPKISWAQGVDNRWRLPSDKSPNAEKLSKEHREKTSPSPVNPTTGTLPPESPAEDSSPSTAQPRPEESASPASPEPTPKKLSPSVVIQTLRIRHGSMDFLNHRRGLLGRFEEVNLDGRMPDLNHAAGTAYLERAILPRVGVRLERVRTDFDYGHDEGLTLNNATAVLAGGQVEANCRVRTADAGTPFEAECRMENVNLDQLIKEAGGKLGRASGQLQGKIRISGDTSDSGRAAAAGDFQLLNGEVHNFSFFQAIGNVLHIDDLRHFQFKTARVVYKVAGTAVEIQPLSLASNDLLLDAHGRYELAADRLDLHARLTIDASVSRQLPKFIQEQFTPCEDGPPGSRYVDFNVTGPLNKPNSDLYQHMLPDALNGLLDRLVRPHPKRTKEKPAPSPVDASPVPLSPSADS